MNARSCHRGLMTVFAVVLTYWVGSGLTMAVYDATDTTQVWALQGGGPGARLEDDAARATPLPRPSTMTAGIEAALLRSGTMAIASVDLRMTAAGARLEFAEADGERDRLARFFAATGEPMSALQADGNPDAPQPPNVVRRNALKAWHRGNVAGIGGQLLGFLAALALMALAVTGIATYLPLWRARCRAGKRAVFWTAREPLWRRLHRWIAVISAALLLNVAITGAVLAAGEIQLWAFLNLHIVGAPYPRPSPLPPVSDAALPHAIAALLDTAYDAARRVDPASPVASIELVHRDGTDKSIVTLGGVAPRTLAFQAETGSPLEDWATRGVQQGQGYFADWHQVLKRLHRGDIVGHFAGRYLALAVGIALAYLLISGTVMYASLRRQRQSAGRREWFWR